MGRETNGITEFRKTLFLLLRKFFWERGMMCLLSYVAMGRCLSLIASYNLQQRDNKEKLCICITDRQWHLLKRNEKGTQWQRRRSIQESKKGRFFKSSISWGGRTDTQQTLNADMDKGYDLAKGGANIKPFFYNRFAAFKKKNSSLSTFPPSPLTPPSHNSLKRFY